MHTQTNFFILTGAPGGGKSSILKELQKRGIPTVEEPARQVIAEQRGFGGNGVWDKDAALFCALVLSRAVFQYDRFKNHGGPVVFDRGVPDNIAYARLAGADEGPARRAAETRRCNPTVFLVPAWKEIYQTDEERQMSFQAARDFGKMMQETYAEMGYTCISVPKDGITARADFILRAMKAAGARRE